ncbi:MAG TPA: hypothetical protein PKI32_03195 [Opitutales bacterium]|nr:hypothetical protein [Opitutales bacterium]
MSFRLRTAFALAFSLLSAGSLRGVVIESVAERSYSEENLTTFREYLDGRERTGRRTYFRSVEDRKAGLYLVADFDTPISELPEGSSLVVDFITSMDDGPRSVSFPVSAGSGIMGKSAYIGLTDPSFAGLRFVAWRLQIVDKSGAPLAESHSFLWEMPVR